LAPTCHNRSVDTETLENIVWDKVKQLLNDPTQLQAEYDRRLRGVDNEEQKNLVPLEKEGRRTRNALDRLLDSYVEGLVEKAEFEPRSKVLRQRLVQLEAQERQLREAAVVEQEIRFLVGQFQVFAEKVRTGLETADFETKQGLIRTMVKRVEIGETETNIVFRVNTRPPPEGGGPDFLHHCPRRWRDGG